MEPVRKEIDEDCKNNHFRFAGDDVEELRIITYESYKGGAFEEI